MKDFDDIDRALFALPLATPPPGLREAILRATIDAPDLRLERVPVMRAWETALLGALLAFATWLGLVLLWDRRLTAQIVSQLDGGMRALADPHLTLWLAVGLASAVCISVLSAGTRLFPQRVRRA